MPRKVEIGDLCRCNCKYCYGSPVSLWSVERRAPAENDHYLVICISGPYAGCQEKWPENQIEVDVFLTEVARSSKNKVETAKIAEYDLGGESGKG